MSDDTKRVIFWVLGIALFMVFYLILLGIVWIVKGSAGADNMLNFTGYVVIAALIAGFLFTIILIVARIFNMATRNIIEFQANDDRGEVVRMAMRNLGQSDKQAMQQASRMAIHQANAIVRASNRQPPTVQEPEPEYADFWPLPQLEDEQYGNS